jgi:hypothetical protein
MNQIRRWYGLRVDVTISDYPVGFALWCYRAASFNYLVKDVTRNILLVP